MRYFLRRFCTIGVVILLVNVGVVLATLRYARATDSLPPIRITTSQTNTTFQTSSIVDLQHQIAAPPEIEAVRWSPLVSPNRRFYAEPLPISDVDFSIAFSTLNDTGKSNGEAQLIGFYRGITDYDLIMWSPDSDALFYVAQDDYDGAYVLMRIDIFTGETEPYAELDFRWVPDGIWMRDNRYIVISGASTVIYDLYTASQQTIPLDNFQSQQFILRDGYIVYFEGRPNQSYIYELTMVEIATGYTRWLDFGKLPAPLRIDDWGFMVWNDDLSQFVVRLDDESLLALDIRSGDAQVFDAPPFFALSWSPGGEWIVGTSFNSSFPYVAYHLPTEKMLMLPLPSSAFNMAWSQNENYLLAHVSTAFKQGQAIPITIFAMPSGELVWQGEYTPRHAGSIEIEWYGD